MSRQRWKKRIRGTEAPPEFSSFCRGIFLALKYGEATLEGAAERAAKEASGQQRSAVRQYLRDVEENEHDPGDLERAWKKAALEGGYMVEGNARDFFLMVGKKLKKSPPRERRARRHG
ncbi:MAG TPA: hypothetical protein VLW88_08150 [Hyphomicrobium sp.]|nr:hypothetical protein [Hyphomicrobium sp.]